MPGGDTRWARPLAAATGLVFVAAALLAVVWDIARTPPSSWGCGDEKPAGHDVAIAAYRDGYLAAHLIVGAAALAVVVALSVLRRVRAGRTGPGAPTALAAGALLALSLAAAAGSETAGRLVGVVALLAALGLLLAGENLGLHASAVLGIALTLVAGVWSARAVARTPRALLAAAALWTLVLAVAGHAVTVGLRNDGPLLC